MIEFDVDKQLQEIAEEVTKHGLNFCGAEFDHLETGETFTITVSRNSSVREMQSEVFVLRAQLKEAQETLERLNEGYSGSAKDIGESL